MFDNIWESLCWYLKYSAETGCLSFARSSQGQRSNTAVNLSYMTWTRMSLCLTKHTELMALQAAVVNGLSANGLALPLVNICQSCASFVRTLKEEEQCSPLQQNHVGRLHIGLCVSVLLKVHCGPSNRPHQLSKVVNHVCPGWTSWSRARGCHDVQDDVFCLRGVWCLVLETCISSSVERHGWKSLGFWQIYLCFIRPQKSKLLQRELLVSVVHNMSQFTDSHDSRALWERWQMLS